MVLSGVACQFHENYFLDRKPSSVLLTARPMNLPHKQDDVIRNVSHNWWGTTKLKDISNRIYDYYDDPKRPKVRFLPYLTKSPFGIPWTPPFDQPQDSMPTPTNKTDQPVPPFMSGNILQGSLNESLTLTVSSSPYQVIVNKY